MFWLRSVILISSLTAMLVGQSPTATVSVPGTAAIWLAGQPLGATACGDVAPTQSPILCPLSISAGSIVSFPAVTGTTGFNPSVTLGPEGGPIVGLSNSLGIGGITAPLNALIGVFMPATVNTGPWPASLNFPGGSSIDFAGLAPELFQPFFIGDGRRSNLTTVQQFLVPPGATRLFLGLHDCGNWNNPGALTVQMRVDSAAFNPANGHYYQLSPTPMTPQAYFSWCQSVGGYPLAVSNAAEQAWLSEQFGIATTYLIGLTDDQIEGQFYWINGEPVTYTNWTSGEPNNFGSGEDYVVMNWQGSNRWNDIATGYLGYGIAEISIPTPIFTSATPCGQSLAVTSGATLSITLGAVEPIASLPVTLSVTGAPPDATFNPPLPLTGISPTTMMSWSPTAVLPLTYSMNVTATASNGVSTQCTIGLQQTPFVDLTVVPGSLAAQPAAPSAGNQTIVTAAISNEGVVTAQARVDFYLGDPAFNGILLNTQTGTLGFGVTTTVGFPWTPTQSGVHDIFVTVTNLTQPDNDSTNDRASIQVNVGAPPEQILVQAGEVTVWPGAVVETAVLVRNVGSGPVSLVNLGSTSSWVSFPNGVPAAPIIPGSSVTVLANISVPSSFVGNAPTGSSADYTLPISAQTATAIFGDDIIAHFFAAPVSQVTVRVVDANTTAPLPGSNIAVQDVPLNLVANGAGEAVVSLPQGSRSFFAYHTGYVAAAITETVLPGSSTVTIALVPGESLAITQITSTQLTTAQVLARGIDPMTAANNVIYDFVVALQIGPPIVIPSVPIPMNPPPVYTFTAPAVGGPSEPPLTGGGSGGPGPAMFAPPSYPTGTYAGGTWVTATFEYHPSPAPGIAAYRTETWIIIPGRVSALKQFFEVSMYVKNQAVTPPGMESQVRIENTIATLSGGVALPAGLGLPDLNGMPQSLVQNLGTINAGEAKQASWIVRGDQPGSYVLAGGSSGDLYAFSNLIATITTAAMTNEFNVVLPQLRLSFETPSAVSAGQPFSPPFRVSVTNEQVVTASYVRVALDVNRLVNCHLAPIQPPASMTGCPSQGPVTFLLDPATGEIVRAEVVIGDIAPGETKCAEFEIIADVTGQVLQTQTSVWQSTDTSPPLVVAADLTGTGDDLRLLTGLSPAVPDAVTLKFLTPGQTMQIALDSPSGTYWGSPFVLAVEAIVPGSIPSIAPGLHLDSAAIVLLNGLVNPGFFISPGGNNYQFSVIPGLDHLTLVLQGFVFDSAASGVVSLVHFAATDAHELRFIR